MPRKVFLLFSIFTLTLLIFLGGAISVMTLTVSAHSEPTVGSFVDNSDEGMSSVVSLADKGDKSTDKTSSTEENLIEPTTEEASATNDIADAGFEPASDTDREEPTTEPEEEPTTAPPETTEPAEPEEEETDPPFSWKVDPTHTPGETTLEMRVEPTCTENGSYFEVTWCRAHSKASKNPIVVRYRKVIIPSFGGHDMGEWVVVKEPTDTASGLRERKCSRCNHKETSEIPMQVVPGEDSKGKGDDSAPKDKDKSDTPSVPDKKTPPEQSDSYSTEEYEEGYGGYLDYIDDNSDRTAERTSSDVYVLGEFDTPNPSGSTGYTGSEDSRSSDDSRNSDVARGSRLGGSSAADNKDGLITSDLSGVDPGSGSGVSSGTFSDDNVISDYTASDSSGLEMLANATLIAGIVIGLGVLWKLGLISFRKR